MTKEIDPEEIEIRKQIEQYPESKHKELDAIIGREINDFQLRLELSRLLSTEEQRIKQIKVGISRKELTKIYLQLYQISCVIESTCRILDGPDNSNEPSTTRTKSIIDELNELHGQK